MRRDFLPFALALLAAAIPASAQIEGKPFVEEEKRKTLDPDPVPPPPEQDLLWDWGGWFNPQYLSIGDEPSTADRSQRYWDLRVWGSVSYTRTWRLYVRLRNTYQDWNDGDQFGKSDDDLALLRLDQGYIDGFWGDPGETPFGEQVDVHLRAGRQYLRLGSGLLLNGPYDGAQVAGFAGAFRYKALAAHTIINEDDIDRSIQDRDDSHRVFVGGEVEYGGLGAFRPTLLALLERDLNHDTDPVQDYAYDALYLGIGLRGLLPVDGLSAQLETIYEGGTSAAAGGSESESISAFALNATIDYRAPWPTAPRFGAAYIRASGDGDRGSPTDTASGNLAGTTDEGFLSFGYLQAGFSLFPRISNIHIFKVEATCRPLESVAGAESLEVGLALYSYRKDESAEAISDPRSTVNDEDVGSEIDLSLRWRALSDVGVSLDFGRFFPGGAYVDDGPRDFLSLSATYSF